MKKKSSLLNSFKFLYKEGYKYKKSYIPKVILHVLLAVVVSMPLLFIPTVAVKYLNDTKNYPMFALWVGIIFVIYLLLSALNVTLDIKTMWDHHID